MNRKGFIKALLVLPMVPLVLKELKPVSEERIIICSINGQVVFKTPIATERNMIEVTSKESSEWASFINGDL